MAKQTTVRLVDDMDGSPAESTIAFGVGRDSYEIDLSAENSAKLRDVLAEFVAAARQVRGKRSSTSAATPARSTLDRVRVQAIREWARENGYTISDRGRVPAAVQEAYDNRNEPGGSVTPIRPTAMVASSPAAEVALTEAKPFSGATIAAGAAAAVDKQAAKAAKAADKAKVAKGKTTAGLPKVEAKPVGVKVTAMSGMQVAAVENLRIPTHSVAKSFVIFKGDTPIEVLGRIRAVLQDFDGDTTQGDYAAMRAVVRALEAADPKKVKVVEIAA